MDQKVFNPFNLSNQNKLNEPNQLFFPNINTNISKEKNIFGNLNKNEPQTSPFAISSQTDNNKNVPVNPFLDNKNNLNNVTKNIFPFSQNQNLDSKKDAKALNFSSNNNIDTNIFSKNFKDEKKEIGLGSNATNPFSLNKNDIKSNPFLNINNNVNISFPNIQNQNDITSQNPKDTNLKNNNKQQENFFTQMNNTNNNNIFEPNDKNKNFNFADFLNGINKSEKEKEKEKGENNLINNITNNKKEKNKYNQFEFSASPKKPLEIIKEEEEELKFKKESSNIELFNENKFNNVEKDSEPVKEKSNNINKLINENEQNNKKINEDNISNINEEKNENENENFVENDNKENKKIENPNNINIENIENNNVSENNIKLENIINISQNEEEINKIIDENNNQVDNLINEYHLNIINDMIDLNVYEFKNKIKEFINFSAEKINSIKILNDICNKIKEKIVINYNIMIEKQNININEYNILKEYDEKLDYVITIQNNVLKELKDVNNELKMNINSFNNIIKKNDVEISDKEINDNIIDINKNINNLENILKNYVSKDAFENLNNINYSNDENDNFFNILQNIYTPLKQINKAYEQLLLENSS